MFSPLELLGFDDSITTKGYTGHEQLNELGLIHMNGRVYDPKLARFLQADPFIQAASNTQSYNRYSYVWNNPLNATDPSGYFSLKRIWDDIRPYVGAIVAVVATYLCGGNIACGEAAWLWIGAVAGAAGAAANGGNIIQGALFGAFSGFAYTALGPLGAGIAGAYSAEVMGTNPGRAFWAAGIGAAFGGIGANGVERFITATIAGGVASKITGGKFANGASTAAFMWALRAGVNKLWRKTTYELEGNPDAIDGIPDDPCAICR